MRRVVITGLGIVSCLGNNQEEVYQSLLNSKSGITFSEEYKEHNLKSHVHGKPNIKLEDHVDRKTIRFMGSGSAYNYIAMKEAIRDSGLEENEVSNFKTGIVMGSGGPSIENVILAADKTRAKTPPPPAITKPSLVLSYALDAVSGVSLYFEDKAVIASNMAVIAQ